MRIEEFSLGDLKVYGISDGYFHLDGGAMFGVVPKILWEKKYPSDSANRIRLALNSLLIRTPKDLILIETGIGSKFGQKFSGLYSVEQEPGLVPSLRELGVRPEDIDLVVNTHLHFDHSGGNTMKGEDGIIVPTFPQARYVIQKGEWEDALNPNERDKASYIRENFLPLEKAGQLLLVDGDTEIADGVEVVLSPGHTAHHQCVKIKSMGRVLFYLGDLVPTSAHVRLAYVMSYDLYPLETLKTKKRFYDQAIEEDWVMAFVHDSAHYFGRVRKAANKYEFQPLSKP
ncbi:MAG: MBL fold metallo-hydrolase [Candidatus Aminicenantales bacterium]